MRTKKDYDKILEIAHKLEIALSANNPQELEYDESIFVALQCVMDGLDIPKPRKVYYLHRVMGLYT
jgi:hypothetical protein